METYEHRLDKLLCGKEKGVYYCLLYIGNEKVFVTLAEK